MIFRSSHWRAALAAATLFSIAGIVSAGPPGATAGVAVRAPAVPATAENTKMGRLAIAWIALATLTLPAHAAAAAPPNDPGWAAQTAPGGVCWHSCGSANWSFTHASWMKWQRPALSRAISTVARRPAKA